MDAFITCCILFASYILYIVASDRAYTYSKDKYTCIRREWRLLDALLKDFDAVSKAYQITQRARQPMDYSELNQETVLLNEENAWITKARKGNSKATWCVQRFQKLREKRNSSKWFVSVLVDMIPMVAVAFRMYWIENMINNDLGNNHPREEKICASDIYGSLEKSRSKFRSLQDRSIVDGIEHQSFKSKPTVLLSEADKLISSLKKLSTENPELMNVMEGKMESFEMHLQLLRAFMEDLQCLKLESRLESSWVIEVNVTIGEAKDAIDTINTAPKQKRWLSDPRNWTERWKLKDEIMCVGTWISDLLEIKERYGFKFIRRDSSRSAHRSQQQTFQYQTTDDMDLASAVNDICHWLIQLSKTSNKLVPRISSLREELEGMHQLLKDTKVTEYASNFRNACLEQLKKMASEVEQYSKTHMEDSESKLNSEINRIKDAVKLLQRCIRVYSIEVRADSCSVVGLEEDIHDLVKGLTNNSKHGSIISIVGMKGIGKTTLAKKLYYHDTIAKKFAVRRWVSIPQEYSDENALFTSVGNQVLETKDKRNEKDYWINKVQAFLKDKLYLLVLDNVSSVEAWDALKVLFTETTNGRRIVLTTSNKAVASHVDKKRTPHLLRLRTKEESWELFTQMVHPCPDKMEAHAKKVVGRGGGLPLTIIRIGKLLSGKKMNSEEFFRVLERITQEENQTPWLDAMEVNKKELQLSSTNLGKCFSYFQLFSRDFEIPVRRIVASWIAQGLVQVKGDEILEDVANKYLSELIGSNMIQVVQRKPNGKVKTCCLPTTVRDLLWQGESNSRGTRSRSSLTTSIEGQLSFHCDDNDADFSQIHGFNTSSPNAMRMESDTHSILFFDTREGNKPGAEIGEFLRRGIADGFFLQLQVLDLERVFRPQLPKNIGKLKQLAYLGLRWTYLEIIPDSIGNLGNLQTLDVKHTYVRTLPSSIWKLKKLRHLYLNQNCQLPQPSANSMRNLQILSGAFVDKRSPLKDGLSKLNNLRKLGLAFHLAERERDVLETWIVQLTQLESLRLTSINEKRVPQPLKLQGILGLKNLSSLYLYGTLENSSIMELPENLTHLTLSATGIKDNPMPMLGMLRKLRSLSLYSRSYTGTDLVCSKYEFPLLLVLKLWKLDNLEILDVKEGAMQKLKELEIRSCRKLKISIGLTHLKTLQEFKVT